MKYFNFNENVWSWGDGLCKYEHLIKQDMTFDAVISNVKTAMLTEDYLNNPVPLFVLHKNEKIKMSFKEAERIVKLNQL